MSWDDDDMPWSPAEQDAYRQGRKLWARQWLGPSPETLWRLYGRENEGKGISECPDCGRPWNTREMEKFQKGLCWNCWKENESPGWQAEAIGRMSNAPVEAKGKETNPLAGQMKRLK